jgi:hypothetical protein
MPPEERQARNIPRDYADNPLLEADRDRRNREREEYMLAQAIRGAEGGSKVLIICGRLHAEPLATAFRGQAHCVEVDDVQRQNWYAENWIEHLR